MKKKRFITWIIVLMSVSLIFIILLQTFHLKNSYRRASEIIDRGISDAINRTLLILQKQDAIIYIYDKFNTTQSSDSVVPIDPYMVQLGSHPAMNQLSGGGFQIQIQNGTGYYDNLKYSFSINSQDMNLNVEEFFAKQFSENSFQFDEIIKQLEQEFFQKRIPIEKRFNAQKIEQVLKQSLIATGINMNFEFAIIDQQQKIKIKSKGFKKDRIDKCYRYNLAPTSLFSNPDIFLVDFPQKSKYTLSSIYAQLFSSIALTLLFIISFGASIFALIKQKKISEIKNDFISNMTHEFKTPLATIKLAVSNLKNEKTRNNPEMTNAMLEIISQETNRMNHHVEQVLQMSLLDKQNLILNKKKTNINELVSEAVENIELIVAERGGETELNFCSVDVLLNIDPELMMNAIRNLLDNAIKYCKEAPLIQVTTYISNNSINISIKDNGIGMSKDVQKRIFERFYRATTGNVHDIKGFGLGLNYVYEIVKAHKGDISVKSSPGKGSNFIISLPLK
ncbi:MAG TPA: HAMP domain-containing sensor histidine kinase [Bacteroidales bacterium]|nr:HAMP domain-containing sensor histidine kinase [Bacteroidales bacterium]